MSTELKPDLYGSYSWSNASKGLYYGPGCMESALSKLIGDIGASKALIVTGRSLKEKVCSGLFSVRSSLNEIDKCGQ